MDRSYLAGFCDGDGTICIGKCRGGFQCKLEFTQCHKAFIDKLETYYGGRVYVDTRHDKYSNENALQLRFCGNSAVPILNIMKEHAVIKKKQAEMALEYLSMYRQRDKFDMREQIFHEMKALNANKQSYTKNYSVINYAYIAGLFDAEGNVYNSVVKNKQRYYVKITQKADPLLLKHIQTFLNFGKIPPSEPHRLVFHSKKDIVLLWTHIGSYLVVKRERYKQLIDQFETKIS